MEKNEILQSSELFMGYVVNEMALYIYSELKRALTVDILVTLKARVKDSDKQDSESVNSGNLCKLYAKTINYTNL